MKIYKHENLRKISAEFLANCAVNTNLYVGINYNQDRFPDVNSSKNINQRLKRKDACRTRVSKHLNKLLKLVNREVFGNNFRRKKQSLGCIHFIEFNYTDGVHSHLLIGMPIDYLNKLDTVRDIFLNSLDKMNVPVTDFYIDTSDENKFDIAHYNLKDGFDYSKCYEQSWMYSKCESIEPVDLYNLVITDQSNKVIKSHLSN